MSPNDLSNIFGVECKCLDCDVYSFQVLLSLHMGTVASNRVYIIMHLRLPVPPMIQSTVYAPTNVCSQLNLGQYTVQVQTLCMSYKSQLEYDH